MPLLKYQNILKTNNSEYFILDDARALDNIDLVSQYWKKNYPPIRALKEIRDGKES